MVSQTGHPIERDIPIHILRDVQAYRRHFGLRSCPATTIEERVFDSLTLMPNGCMISTRAPQSGGYIQIQMGGDDGPKFVIHRVMWALTFNEWPPADQVVMHGCDTPRCCAPKCLTLGTNKKNTEDMMQKGRNRTRPPLTVEEKARVRELRAQGLAHHVIAELTGHCRETVRRHAP